MNHQSKVALVTGAARRIGAAIVQNLHQAGFKVIIHYHKSEKEAQALAARLNAIRPDSAWALAQDLADLQAETFLQTVIEKAGRLDVLVNNASLFLKNADLSWDILFQVNVKAPWLLSQAAFPFLQETQGNIINITDIHAEKPLQDYAIYCQSKAALVMQTKALALEFAPIVRVNGVAPGAIAWPEGENALSDSRQQKIIEKTVLKKHGKPEYIAQTVLALAENDYVTGQIWSVDGGRSIR